MTRPCVYREGCYSPTACDVVGCCMRSKPDPATVQQPAPSTPQGEKPAADPRCPECQAEMHLMFACEDCGFMETATTQKQGEKPAEARAGALRLADSAVALANEAPDLLQPWAIKARVVLRSCAGHLRALTAPAGRPSGEAGDRTAEVAQLLRLADAEARHTGETDALLARNDPVPVLDAGGSSDTENLPDAIRRLAEELAEIAGEPCADEIEARVRAYAADLDTAHEELAAAGRGEWAHDMNVLRQRLADVEQERDAAVGNRALDRDAMRQAIAKAESAEASLRTLGDALERARAMLRVCRYSVPIVYNGKAWADAVMDELLTPPTRDTSCEAVAKQETGTSVDWEEECKIVQAELDHHMREIENGVVADTIHALRHHDCNTDQQKTAAEVIERLYRQFRHLTEKWIALNERMDATPSSPSDKGADD